MNKEEARKLAWDHAWKAFQLHAGQRITLFNIYILGFIAGCAGYFSALQSGRPLTSALISALGILFSIVFKMLDARNSHLIKIAEDSIKEQEYRLAEVLGDVELRLFWKAEEKPKAMWSFRQAFNLLFCTAGVACIAAFGLALAARP